MTESTYRTLVAWQRAIDLAIQVHTISKTFPREERFSLTAQIRRCATSVPSNIAEGRGRGSARDYRHFLRHFLHQARGSLYEMDTQITLARRLGYCSDADIANVQRAISETARPLQGLIAALDRKIGGP
ncbi:MAG TPA: four helix bundle protein [Thermoanaerobaculia bacterium]|nr:four helix bundle protein [Thermoanaerobaculia bacterium]